MHEQSLIHKLFNLSLSFLFWPLVYLLRCLELISEIDASGKPCKRRTRSRNNATLRKSSISNPTDEFQKVATSDSEAAEANEEEEEEAKAIADSLVTRADSTETLAIQANGRRRSVRILRLQNEEGKIKSLKSPTSAALSPDIAKKAKQRALVTSRPLIPNKQVRKTLILDLDETLIHSLSKGGKMSSGHMVEVRLGTHAILYYVHKRPFCDFFLEKVAPWYDIVIFTASVQEYADPVIDWLEQDRKYFKARYYRQHCTFKFGAYMKDLTVAEHDLSKAIIVDNSPLSYRMNEENAIPIEGWISDPSDRDLLFLIPVLQGLRHISDVRSLLSLRQPD